jgi:hypothetical protein
MSTSNQDQPVPQQPAQGQLAPRQSPETDTNSRVHVLKKPYIAYTLLISVIGLPAVALVVVLILGVTGKTPIVHDLSNVDAARGLITFIFTMGTMFIALLLVLGALLGEQPEETFTKGKEVLTVLIGVFGTILGFYFGTMGNGQKIDVAGIRIFGNQITTHVTGGTSPYRYSITFSDQTILPITDRVSKDGWITETPSPIPTTGTITVDVADSRDFRGSAERRLSPPSPTPEPAKSAATQSPSPGTPSPTPKPGKV